ncbi:DUF1566 domain-containing protein [Sorangium sp. So ce362]|uniref:Lcl C-terminal domain-containing protein n=1 Tax=Sorangium sp. So ce362 TaxID=3133303 RepID=UPI003F63472A
MPNETSHALRFTRPLAALLVELVALAGCVGDPFHIGHGSGGGIGGGGGSEPIGGGGSEPIGGGGGEPIGGGGAGGGTGGGPPTVPVIWPDSPTKRCSNGTTVLEACPGPSEPFFGQDGNYEIAVPSYTEGDGTVTDSVTGLTWEKVTENVVFTREAALQHCAVLDAERAGGIEKWRLPTRRELVSILDFGHITAFPDIFFTFTDAQGGFYWSATDVDADSTFAWGVLASDASVGFFQKDMSGARALCVGGERETAPPDLSFGEEWVLDGLTGLVWQRQASLTRFIWSGALEHCEELTLAGKSDWRLPSAKELLSIVDDRLSGPAIDREAFPGTPSDVFWSSTPAISSAEKAILVNFTNGTSQDHSVRAQRLTRCVRSDG